jgi:hypothetical protein
MNKTLVTIVALSVDSRHATLYMADGSTMNIPQGDARLPSIVAAAKLPLEKGESVLVDVTPVLAQRTEFIDAENGTQGMIKFFRVAKTFLRHLINTDSPENVDVTLALVTPLQVGTFPGQDDPQPAMADEIDVEATDSSSLAQAAQPAGQTNDEKVEAARTRMNMLIGNSKSTATAEFHAPLDESTETIVAVHSGTGAIVPDAHKLSRQLRQASRLQDFAGFQKFVERLSVIIDQRGHSVEDLMKFIEKGDLPIADDGSIVIYKRLVRSGNGVFLDPYTKKIRQKVGSFVFMRAELVDPNRRQDCSHGLHVASLGYLGNSYFSSNGGDVTIVAKVRPEDVWAVPQYDATKMRVCGYHILVELPEKLRQIVNSGGSISSDKDGAILLNSILRGNHVGISQHVEIGGQMGANVTYTDVEDSTATRKLSIADATRNSTLDLNESLEPEVPTAPGVRAHDLKSNESSITSIMSNGSNVADTQQTGQVGSQEGNVKSLDQKGQAAELYRLMLESSTPVDAQRYATRLKDFKKTARKGWAALGLPETTGEDIAGMLGEVRQSTPQAAPVIPNHEKMQALAIKYLKEGSTNVEVAKKTGLSKDQVYRLKKKL